MKSQNKFKKTEIGEIPEDWDIENLGNFVELERGISYKSEHYCSENEGYFFINLKCVGSKGLFKKEGIKFIKIKSTSLTSNKIVQEGDILIANTDLTQNKEIIGSVIKIPKLEKTAFFSLDLSKLKIIKKINKNFLFYFLLTPYARNFMISSGSGTTVVHLLLSNIPNMKILVPPLPEQHAIAKILSSFDEKIELNDQMNKTLEEMGQAIFKRWFIDFEFPNEDGKPYKSSGGKMVWSEELQKEIPEGWEVGFLGDGILTNILKTGINIFEGEKIYLDTASVQGTKIVSLDTKITYDKRPSRANMQPLPKTVWFAKMKNSKKILFFDTYSEFGLKNFILSTGFAGLSIKDYAFYYVYSYILSEKFEKEKDNLCQGTTMQAINNENIMKIKILVPPKEILIKFENLTKILYKKIYTLFEENLVLSQIRDLLLPKLVFGKIRVPISVKG